MLLSRLTVPMGPSGKQIKLVTKRLLVVINNVGLYRPDIPCHKLTIRYCYVFLYLTRAIIPDTFERRARAFDVLRFFLLLF